MAASTSTNSAISIHWMVNTQMNHGMDDVVLPAGDIFL